MGGRWRFLGVFAVAAAVLLGACSSDDSSSSPAPAPSDEKVVLEAYGVAPATQKDLDRAATIVQQRLRALGVHDAAVKVNGQKLIATGTGVGEASAKVLQPGLLEFRPVIAYIPPAAPGDTNAPDVFSGRPGNAESLRYQLGSAVISGDSIASAKPLFLGGSNGWVVNMQLRPGAISTFNDLARISQPKQPPQNSVAIVLDGVVQSAPAFAADRFDGGEVQISGMFTETEVTDLAAVLGFGSLPVPLRLAG